MLGERARHKTPITVSTTAHRLVGLVVKASFLGAEEFDSRLRHEDFSGSSHTSDLRTGTPVATLPDAGLVDPVSVYCDLVRSKV